MDKKIWKKKEKKRRDRREKTKLREGEKDVAEKDGNRKLWVKK